MAILQYVTGGVVNDRTDEVDGTKWACGGRVDEVDGCGTMLGTSTGLTRNGR